MFSLGGGSGVAWLAALLLSAGLSAAARAATPAPDPGAAAIVTILEGEASVLQGLDRFAVVAGWHVPPGSLIETGAHTTLLRLEAERSAIDLGPDTRALLAPEGFGKGAEARPALYLLQGWTKLSSADGAARHGVISVAFDVVEQTGVTVAFVSAAESTLFVESGEVRLVERRAGKAQPSITLHGGECYVQDGPDRGRVLTRQTPAMLERLPRVYRDTVPLRAAMFQGQEPEPRPLAAPSYAELQPWLTAEPALRRGFVRRFLPRAKEPEFRRALVAHLAEHPEWRPILFPPPPPKPASHPLASSAAAYR